MESPPPNVPAPIYPSAPMSPDYELPEILLTIPSGVVLYYIDKSGNAVTTLPSPTFLQIFRSPDYQELGSDDNPAAYLVVRNGEWSYPLIPRKSPVFLSKSGIYTFPDLSHEQQEQQQQQQQPQQQQQYRHSVAIVLDSTVSEANKKLFKEILDGASMLRREGESGNGSDGGSGSGQQRTMTEAAVLKGAEMIGKGIVIGAKVAEYGMQKGAEAAQKYMEPEPGKPVDPNIKKGIEYAKRGSEVTKYAAGKVEGWVGDATRSVGRSLARIIFGKDDGSSSSSSSSSTMQQIKWILKLGLQGLGVVFAALEDAKNILKKSIKSETVKVVDYKYGAEAADVAGVAADAFGNLVDTADSAMGIGLSKKTFAKKLVKKTGKEMAKEAVRSVETNRHDVAVVQDGEGRYVLSDAPEAAPKVLERVRRDGAAGGGSDLAPGSPERSRSPLPTSMSYSALKEKADAAPPRPTTLPPGVAGNTTVPKTVAVAEASGAAASSTSTGQGNARFTDDEVEALLALAPTPTHDTLHHALELPQQEHPQRQQSGGGTTSLYPKI